MDFEDAMARLVPLDELTEPQVNLKRLMAIIKPDTEGVKMSNATPTKIVSVVLDLHRRLAEITVERDLLLVALEKALLEVKALRQGKSHYSPDALATAAAADSTPPAKLSSDGVSAAASPESLPSRPDIPLIDLDGLVEHLIEGQTHE